MFQLLITSSVIHLGRGFLVRRRIKSEILDEEEWVRSFNLVWWTRKG